MRIKRLSLQGYKTFATKTDFIFDDGITAIVGPNGSGKSNIADALRWVLGEQSFSTLRGKRTTDMIFAGSRSRTRAGMAQSILTLDNSEGWLPIDFTEVEIGRRAYRSGENEYILNGQKVRLKDITELLARSGLAQRTYTIIGQGLVDRALSLRSEERRALFEEAAGINHYKVKRAETLRRLQDTQRNLLRVHDILAEIRPRLASLKRQATRARNYEQVAADLQNLLRIWYGFKWELSKKELRLARETAVIAEKSWEENRQKLRVRQLNTEDVRRRIHHLEKQITGIESQRETIRDQLETARREVAILIERQNSITRQQKEINAELPGVSDEVSQAESDLAAAVDDLNEAQTQLRDSRQELKTFNLSFQSMEAEISQWQGRKLVAENKLHETRTKRSQTEGHLAQLKERLQAQIGVQVRSHEDPKLASIQLELSNLAAGLQLKDDKNRQAEQELAEAETQLNTFMEDLKIVRQELREKERLLHRQQNELARLETRVDMLDQQRLQAIPTDRGVKILGNLAQFIEIPKKYELAIAAACDARLAALLLPDESQLWQLLQGEPSEHALLALALADINVPEQPAIPNQAAIIGWASDLVVTTDPQAAVAVQLLLGRILVVEDRLTAYRLMAQAAPGTTAVALDGFQVHAGGLIEYHGQQANHILTRETKWRQGVEAVTSQQEEIEVSGKSVSTLQNGSEKKQQEIDQLRQNVGKLRQSYAADRQEAAQTRHAIDRRQQQITFLENQQETQTKEIRVLEQRIGDFELRLESEVQAVTDTSESLSEAEIQLAALPVVENEQHRENYRQGIEAAQTIVAGRQAVVDSRRATLNQLEGQLARLKSREANLLSELEQSAFLEKNKQQKDLQIKADNLDGELGPLRTRLLETRENLVSAEDKVSAAQKETHDAETIYTQVKIAYTQRMTEIENLQERIKADLGIVSLAYDVDQTGPTPLPISGIEELPLVEVLPEDIEDTIQQYRAQLHRMGAVNPDAPEEFDEIQERYDFMTQQIDDLTATEAQLRKVIAELDELTSTAFAATVEKVNEVFGLTFTQLFGGGAGRLILTDPDDLTESGVDIIARLPNRREQALGLLSGGERSLTAVALIFSLLKVSPTPFCVLDEVDAALDEANINRFRELLRELSLETQFIVITHNRGTVQAAQTIYGISMGTDSASQAISIKPEDYIKQRELI